MRENKQKIIGTKVLSLFSITRQNLPYQVKIIFNLFPDLLKLMEKQRLGNVYFLIDLKKKSQEVEGLQTKVIPALLQGIKIKLNISVENKLRSKKFNLWL